MRHSIRIAIIWLVISVIVEVLILLVPIPSPTGSPEGTGEHQTVYMLFLVGAPIFVFVWVVFAYCLITFRARGADDVERPAPPESTPILLLWAGISFVIVLFLAGWGTFTLNEITTQPKVAVAAVKVSHVRQGHGKSRTALVVKPVKPLEVQAIGQEWFWTFRYPSYSGMESRDLVLPVNVPIDLHITSLDVVHSFWIYNFDIKEDAVPGVDNQAWMLAKHLAAYNPDGQNWVKCNELCGIWHGYMKTGLYVRTPSAFASWAKRQLAYERKTGLLKNLPPYSRIYFPTANSNWPPAPQDQSP